MRMNPFIKSIGPRQNPIQKKPIAKRGVDHNKQPARMAQSLEKLNEIKQKNKYVSGFTDKTLTEQKIYDFLEKFETVVFGPMVMEMGWEIIMWSGFIKKYKANNMNKTVIVQTREDRKALYEGYVDEIITFKIPNDYVIISPRTNNSKNILDNKKNNEIIQLLMNDIKLNYPDAGIYNFSNIPYSQDPPINLKNNIYEFKQFENSRDIIINIKNQNLNKRIIFLYSRHRLDLKDRNISVEFWHTLYDKLSQFNNCLFLLSGKSPSYIKPNKKYSNIINLEDYEDESKDINILNLSIEALKESSLSFGLQSSMLLLSRILKVKSLYIGYDNRDMSHSKLYNPFDIETISIAPDRVSDNLYIVNINKIIDKFRHTLQNIQTESKTIYNTWIENDELHVKSMNGSGDILWMYEKLRHLGKKLVFHLCSCSEEELFKEKLDSIITRSNQLFDLITDVRVIYEKVERKQIVKITNNAFPMNWSKEKILQHCDKTEYSFCINYYMEKGFKINEIWPELNDENIKFDLVNNVHYNKKFIESVDNNTIFIQLGTYGHNKDGWSDLNEESIYELIKLLHLKGFKIGVSGRTFDNVNIKSMINNIENIIKYKPISLFDEHLSTCIESVKRSKCLISPINGFAILCLSQGSNLIALWPDYLEAMINTISYTENEIYNSYVVKTFNNKIKGIHISLINDIISSATKI